MSRILATVGMMAFLASPALGQFTLIPGSSIKLGLGASGVGGATFTVDSSPLAGTIDVSNLGAAYGYHGTAHLDGAAIFNAADLTWFFAPLGVDLTSPAGGGFEILGFDAPPSNPISVFSNPTTGFNPGGGSLGPLAGGPPAAGVILTEMLAHLVSNGSAAGGPVTLDSTAWIPPLDGSSGPAPFTILMGPDGSLFSANGPNDEVKITNSFWIDFGDVQAEFMITILGEGAITPEPATMSLLGLGGLALVRRLRRKVA